MTKINFQHLEEKKKKLCYHARLQAFAITLKFRKHSVTAALKFRFISRNTMFEIQIKNFPAPLTLFLQIMSFREFTF